MANNSSLILSWSADPQADYETSYWMKLVQQDI
jgi:hypothetical protein